MDGFRKLPTWGWAASSRSTCGGLLDEDPPHRLRGGGEKEPAILPAAGALAQEPEIRLVDERRGLERLSGLLPSELQRRQLAQLVVNQRQQLTGCTRITVFNGAQDAGYVIHACYDTGFAQDAR